ncbi:MAG: hypothetical protein ACOC2W_00825 [bacterium]
MIEKTCPNCNEKSYSSSDVGEWICPNCNIDINNKEKTAELLDALWENIDKLTREDFDKFYEEKKKKLGLNKNIQNQ